ncbi:hypothetical protein LU631_15275 [Erwinia tracheiphila]|uniref:hypothetical protein n=1 Tax=Erwinia tracheiphila TaxID=65700 RepID=UPI00039AF591|nr:hypothetical protein [Erwinia tracheiphila]UIA86359.1 hypothetical protein LU631_15275 [Erwinia tracheiphila]UIA94679.1 hypothetical protein LU633_13485 [Erwinia tracheiphila]
MEATDGTTLVPGPGEVQFNTGTPYLARPGDLRISHMTKTVGDQPNVQLIIKLKPGANSARIKGICAS